MRLMILLVGLGNPGAKYARNRHNAGFQVLSAIIEHHNLGPERSKYKGESTDGVINGERVLTLRPQTFYNESGNSVSAASRFHKIDVDHVIVFHDEIDLAPGKIRVKKGGGLAGNNGLRSTAAHLGPDFWRVRIGVGHPGRKEAVMPHVLGDFSKSEREEWFDPLCHRIADAIALLLPPSEENANRFMSAVCNPQSGKEKNQSGDRQSDKRPTSPKADPNQSSPPPTAFADALKDLKSKPD